METSTVRKKEKRKKKERMEQNIPFCSRSLILFFLLTRGRKLVGSRLKVISSEARNRFMPDNKDCGLYIQLYIRTEIEAMGKKGQNTHGVAVAEIAG
jgi:hypothetical protein